MSDIDKDSAEFKQAVADAIAEEVKGLKTKNQELIDLNKKLRKQTEIDPAELERVEAERDEWKQKASDAAKAVAKAVKDAEAATKLAQDTDAAFANTLKDAALTEALTKAGVTPALLKAAKALHGGAAQVVDDNGNRVVKIGDKALSEHITEWADSDEGKHFIAAPESNGGGSHGGRSTTTQAGDMGGTRTERAAAIAAKYNLPE